MPDPAPSIGLPLISLTICSRNRPTLLIDTVESVLAGDCLPAEIVVADQSDERNDALATMGTVDGCEVRYFQLETVGVGFARNFTMRSAQHDLLVLTDDDMYVDRSWLANLAGALAAAGATAVVTGRVLAAEQNAGSFAPSTKEDPNPRVYEGRVSADVLYTGNMAMWRSAVTEVGAFDERLGTGARFPAAYDNDFGYRLLEAGYRIHYVPEAVVYHRAWRSGTGDYRRLSFNYGRGKGAFYAKHLRLTDPYMLRRLLWDAIRHLVRFPYRLIVRPRRALGDLSFVRGLMSGATEWLRTERRGPKEPSS